MGGSVAVEHGRAGTVFTVRLPRRRPRDAVSVLRAVYAPRMPA